MTTTKVNLANTVEGILPVANGGTGTSTGVAPGGSTTQVQYNNAGAFAGSANFVFDGTNVGIGGASAGARLQITGTTNGTSRIDLINSTSSVTASFGSVTDGTAVLKTISASALAFGTGDTERMRITSAGVMYLGPLATNFSFTNGSAVNISGSGTGIAGNGTNLTLGVWNGPMVFQAGNNGSALTERMRIDSAGNVNIGTTGIAEKLVVNGAILSRGGQSALFASTTSIDYNAGNLGRFIATGPDASTYPAIVFANTTTTTYAERMRILSAGDVVIGATSQIGSARFGVQRSGAGECIRWTDGATGGAITTVVSFGTNINSDALSFTTNSTERLRIASTGAFGLSGANYGSSGQVLTSAGSGSAPSWTTITSNPGTVTSVSGTGTVSGISLSGTVTSSGNLTLGGTLSVTSANLPTWSVLNVVQQVYTGHNSGNSSSYLDSGVTVTITPSSTSSKVQIDLSLYIGSNGDGYLQLLVQRNGTTLSVGDAVGSATQSTMGYFVENQFTLAPFSWNYVDSPSTTSACTYKVVLRSRPTSSLPWYMNRTENIGDSNRLTGVSTIRATELK